MPCSNKEVFNMYERLRRKNLRSLSLFVVNHTVSDSSCNRNIEAKANINLLCSVSAGLVRGVYDNLFNKFVHNFGSELWDFGDEGTFYPIIEKLA